MNVTPENAPLLTLDPEEEIALRRRFDSVFERLLKAVEKSGRPAGSVALAAISKRHGASSLAALARYRHSLESGLPTDCPQRKIIFGENYMQEALPKQDQLAAMQEASGENLNIRWHFTGHLQSNKAKYAAGRFELIQTLDSLSLAQNLHKVLEQRCHEQCLELRQKALVQINIGDEERKSGVRPVEAITFIKTLQAFTTIDVQGLMCIPPITGNPEESRPYFAAMRQLRDDLAGETGLALQHLSMGMSHDFEVAVEEGASLVRIGTDIFGERK